MANISVRMDDKLKSDMEYVLNELGLNTTTAFTIYAKAIVRERRIPLNLELNTWDELKPEEVNEKLSRADEDLQSGRVVSQKEMDRRMWERYGKYADQ